MGPQGIKLTNLGPVCFAKSACPTQCGGQEIFITHTDFSRERRHANSRGHLNCFHSSEVTFNYDYPLKWTRLLPGNQVHGLLPRTGKARQGFQIRPYHGLHLHLLLGHKGEQGHLAGKDQARTKEKPIYSQEECKTQTGIPEEEIWHGIQSDAC